MRCAPTIALQCALGDPAATNGIAFRVRCGLHMGAVERRDNDYFGTAVNRAARIMNAAHGGQVLLSQSVADLVGDCLPDGIVLRDLGSVRLRDLASPEHVYQVVHPALRQDFPALRSLEATPNNLPAAGDLVHRPRAAARGDAGIARQDPAADVARCRWPGQDAARAAGGCRHHRQLSGWRLAGGVGAVVGWPAGRAGGGIRARRQGGGRAAGAGSACEVCQGPARCCSFSTTASTCSMPAPRSSRRCCSPGPAVTVLASSREPLREAGEATYQVPALAGPGRRQGHAARRT